METVKGTIQHLNASLDAKIEKHFDTLDTDPDVLAQLLADKRSENTRRAYEKDANDFFMAMTGKPATPDSVLEFLHLEERQAVAVVLKYKAKMIQRGLKESTVNRRLAAIKSLVAMGRKLGVCAYSLNDIKGEKVNATEIPQALVGKILNSFCNNATRTHPRVNGTMPYCAYCGIMHYGETR